MSRLTRHSLAALLVLLTTSGARAGLLIDGFATGSQTLVNTTPASSVGAGTAASGALGGARYLTVNNGANTFISVANVVPALDRFDFFSQVAPPANATTFVLRYDGTTGSVLNPTGLGGVNALAGGSDGILFRATNSTTGALTFQFTAYSGAADFSVGTVSVASGATSLEKSLLFSGFATAGGAGANFSNLGALVVRISYAGAQGGSGSLERMQFSQIPEPSSLALFGLAAGTLALAGRRRLRQAR
jgi:hypothetical protein